MSKEKTVVKDPRTQAVRVLERCKSEHDLTVSMSELKTVHAAIQRGLSTPELPGGQRGTLIEREIGFVRDKDGGTFTIGDDELVSNEVTAPLDDASDLI